MAIHNSEIAAAFTELADFLETQGDNPYRVRAYRKAARIISNLPKEVEVLITENYDLTQIYGIGNAIAAQIRQIIKNKKLPVLKRIQLQSPTFISELMLIKGLGPKKIRILTDQLKIKTKRELLTALKNNQLQNLPTFTKKVITKIKQELLHPSKSEKFFRLFHLIPVVEQLVFHLKTHKAVKTAECAGSYRRRTELVNELDILVVGPVNAGIIEYFLKFPHIKEIFSQQKNKVVVRLRIGILVNLRIVTETVLGAQLLNLTGSTEHYAELQKIANKKKSDLTPNGLFKNKKRLTSQTETEIYNQLGLSYIAAEMRENRGEIAAGQKNKLPNLITLQDIRGDLHSHTNATDGWETLETMVRVAAERGYEYLAITDHSQHLAITHGLDKKRLFQQIKLIDKLNDKYPNIVILKSIEMDILEDGSLDFPNSVLKELDLTVCSVHSHFRIPAKKQTDRILRAMDNPYFNILGHATGRLIRRREPYELDMKKIFKAAKERGCFIELNAQPYRLDINDVYCLMAKKMGVKIAISTDAHSRREFEYMRYGIDQARRGWIEPDDVINTRSLVELRKLLKRK